MEEGSKRGGQSDAMLEWLDSFLLALKEKGDMSQGTQVATTKGKRQGNILPRRAPEGTSTLPGP